MLTFLQFLKESAPPDPKIEAWIRSNKKKFKKEYGDKWEEILYATAWKMYNAQEELHEQLELKNSFKHKNIDRKDMPQIKSAKVEDFRVEMTNNGIASTDTEIRIDDLKFTQKNIDFDKVLTILGKLNDEKDFIPVLVSKDHYLLDGHHRTMAYMLYNKATKQDKIPAIQFNAPITKLLGEAE